MFVSFQPQASSVVAIFTIALPCFAASACTSTEAEPRRIQAKYDQTTGRLSRLEFDSNNNGTPDTWAFMDGTRIDKLEADENEDGKIDRWEYYPATPYPASGKPVPDRIERATRMDGKVSRREFFERGSLARIEEDTNGDGALDKWETYVGGVLSVLALDLQHLGNPDRKLIYRPDGTLDRIEVDPDGTGRFQAIKP